MSELLQPWVCRFDRFLILSHSPNLEMTSNMKPLSVAGTWKEWNASFVMWFEQFCFFRFVLSGEFHHQKNDSRLSDLWLRVDCDIGHLTQPLSSLLCDTQLYTNILRHVFRCAINQWTYFYSRPQSINDERSWVVESYSNDTSCALSSLAFIFLHFLSTFW